jgi:TfoX/Sxy family transcriptional regulator of competence genes
MASTQDYLYFVLDLLREIPGISYKKMMGEYLLSKDGVLFGVIYDNRFLLKKTPSLEPYHLKEEIPYPTGKMMLLVDSESPKEVGELVLSAYRDLTAF